MTPSRTSISGFEAITALVSRSRGSFELSYQPDDEAPWKCALDTSGGEFGEGTGRTADEAIEDALLDYETPQ